MVEVSTHLVDQVLPRVQHRQWVLSVPRRVRWRLRHRPEVISGLLMVAQAAEGRLRRRNFHDVVILAPVRHNRVQLQAATPVDVSVIIIAFVRKRPVIVRIFAHIGKPTRPPAVRPARPPPQGEFQFDQTLGPDDRPEMDQTAELGDGWE